VNKTKTKLINLKLTFLNNMMIKAVLTTLLENYGMMEL